MSRKGDRWDNAVVESFFATLKTELLDQEIFRTRAQPELSSSSTLRSATSARGLIRPRLRQPGRVRDELGLTRGPSNWG